MRETTILLEKAGAGLAEWVAHARREQVTIVLLEASAAVARLVPASENRCTGLQLASVLAGTDLDREEARGWAEDLVKARAGLESPEDRWQ